MQEFQTEQNAPEFVHEAMEGENVRFLSRMPDTNIPRHIEKAEVEGLASIVDVDLFNDETQCHGRFMTVSYPPPLP